MRGFHSTQQTLLPHSQNNCTVQGLLLRAGHHYGKHVRRHLHWQSKDELTQLFPMSLILAGILRVTEKNTLARNGDNSDRGAGGMPRELIWVKL